MVCRAESTGLAICVDLSTRQSLAKLHYKVLTRDRLVIQGEGLEQVPLLVITAAKVS